MPPRKPKPPVPKVARLTTMALAKHLKVSRETITAWNRKGLPRSKERTADGKTRSLYDPAEVQKWLEEQGSARANDMRGAAGDSEEAPPVGESSPPETLAQLKIDLALAELRRRRADAEKREHALAVTRGLYLPAAEVEQGRIARISAVKAKLLALPARLGSRCANRDAVALEREADDEVRRVLEEFAKP